ncbi:uncharacterized protein LOC113353116 [Papaver somniferum]|uniref:uncharacterized protein LOC113353116 n=1 Tax=Papaver somniferum TaxID=3469 RepID=UPI000E6FA84B|nr:uncharacterized protein LOC113353116 [Papaver somniferum]
MLQEETFLYMKKENPAAVVYLEKAGFESWSRAFFDDTSIALIITQLLHRGPHMLKLSFHFILKKIGLSWKNMKRLNWNLLSRSGNQDGLELRGGEHGMIQKYLHRYIHVQDVNQLVIKKLHVKVVMLARMQKLRGREPK